MSTSNNQVTLEVPDDSASEAPNGGTQRIDASSGARSWAAARNSLGFGDRINNVIREIRPLVENARMGSNPRIPITQWLPRNTPHAPSDIYSSTEVQNAPTGFSQPTHSGVAHVNLGAAAQTYSLPDRPVLQAGQRSPVTSHGLNTANISMESNNDVTPESPLDINISVNPSNNNNIGMEHAENESLSDDGLQQVLDIRAMLNIIIKYSPFYLILLVKFMYDCREGLFTFLILFTTFLHGNNIVKREYGKQTNRNLLCLFAEFVYNIGCVTIVHLLFGHGKLLSNLIMFPPYTEPIDIWELMWLVCLTDLIVKIITVNIKVILTAMPANLVPYQKRGKVYLFIEATSQLYRCILPIQPWLYYLMESYQGSEKMIGMFLSAAYVIAKGVELLVRIRLSKTATWTLLQSVNLGSKPSKEQLIAAGDSCPICHDDYTTPVRLTCSHIYCELCISAWLDREHTCPLCRAKVADEPSWRDGSTTQYFQLY